MKAMGDLNVTFWNGKIFGKKFNELKIRFVVFGFGAYPHIKKFVARFDDLFLFRIGVKVDGETHRNSGLFFEYMLEYTVIMNVYLFTNLLVYSGDTVDIINQ